MTVDGGGGIVYPRRSIFERQETDTKHGQFAIREEAITSGDRNAALDALKAAQPEIMRGANKGVMHGNTASRKVSRLHHRVNAMTA